MRRSVWMVYRMSPGADGLAVGQRGYWEDATTFVLDRDEIANIDAYLIRLHFAGDTVSVDTKERTRGSGVQFQGKATGW